MLFKVGWDAVGFVCLGGIKKTEMQRRLMCFDAVSGVGLLVYCFCIKGVVCIWLYICCLCCFGVFVGVVINVFVLRGSGCR